MKSNTFIAAAIWLALFAGVIWMADKVLNPNKAEVLGNAKTVVLQRDPSGHYRAEALINGIKADVLVDTGATGVAISQKLADSLGLSSNAAISTTTANGQAVSYLLRLASVKLGGIEAKDVAATITPGLEGEALLGMSFLSRMDIRLYKGEMTIKQVEVDD
ncbi:MAG: retroviral-like aspartic protease family protein [Methylophilaceae bacterium]|nr:retroviral-like aspartic protease family protein [Methylophilaceae bacterium]